ncbi:MAG: DJ-1/PfpI family protein, partial [Nonlabens sp.]
MKSIVYNLTNSANLILTAFLVILLTSCNDSSKTETQAAKEEISKPVLTENAYNVGFLIMDGTFNTELTAPFDIFQHTKYREGIKPMNVFLVAQTMDAVTTFEGIRILPDYTFENAPKIDILVVPSAEHHLDTDLENATMINFVKQVSEDA